MFFSIKKEKLKLIVRFIILSAVIASPFLIVSNWIIKEIKERNQLVFNSTKTIVEKNLSLSSIQRQKIDGLSYLDAYSYELRQLISEAESGNLFYIVITNLENEIKITNIDNNFDTNGNQSKQIINLYQNNNQNNGYDKITRINIKSARNKYGINNNIGYAYFRYHPQKVKEIKQGKAWIRIIAMILYFFVLFTICFLLSYLRKENSLKQMINRGENQGVEFKPGFFTDRNIEKKRSFEHECAKSISSFLNTNGGYLFIGVSDDGEIQGLDRDFEYIRNKRSRDREALIDPNKSYHDEYIRKIKGCLGKRIHKNAVLILKLDIKEIDNKEILAIKCPPARVLVPNRTKINNKAWEICFRKDSETVVYQEIGSNLNDNQILPLWKLIVTNFSNRKRMSRLLLWKIKSLFIQI